jgi:hypothetical protein
MWSLLRLKSEPPVTRTAVALTGREITVSDAKARGELGYAGVVTLEQGLAELTRAAAESCQPILMGAHTLVGPGVPLLLRGARRG